MAALTKMAEGLSSEQKIERFLTNPGRACIRTLLIPGSLADRGSVGCTNPVYGRLGAVGARNSQPWLGLAYAQSQLMK
jgi:hypothetical protein